MSKLYIFGIGGTGSRVLRALTMLLASGVKCGADAIVPIIIDPDESAADLTRTVEQMQQYRSIHSNLLFTSESKNKFFATEIEETIKNFRMPLSRTRNIPFKDYIELDAMDKENKAMLSLLFSAKKKKPEDKVGLDSDMEVGFKGNPNIGSVVLNQIEDSPELQDFAQNFQDGERIFIISSIFGGTGASGFPLLAKILRTNKQLPNYDSINKAQIGAVTVMPYFGVNRNNGNGQIDSGTFISKTKAALSYYQNNISNNNTVNHLYYIGDTIKDSYENFEGGAEQKNNAHLIELISALSIIDFSFAAATSQTKHKEFGLEKDSQQVIFSDFGKETRDAIQVPLTQFMLYCNYIREAKEDRIKKQVWFKKGGLDESFFTSDFYTQNKEFLIEYSNWLKEAKDNKRSLSLFELDSVKNAFDIVLGNDPSKFSLDFNTNYALFDSRLNRQSKKKNANNAEQYYTELFFNATQELIEKKIKL